MDRRKMYENTLKIHPSMEAIAISRQKSAIALNYELQITNYELLIIAAADLFLAAAIANRQLPLASTTNYDLIYLPGNLPDRP
ncbi:hypothetical protein NIES22_07520 [Calothrix brevissima NIES-22]|nr:hypothetical protein NIES22_07520 [Calothrix brevissima NIES-22]